MHAYLCNYIMYVTIMYAYLCLSMLIYAYVHLFSGYR